MSHFSKSIAEHKFIIKALASFFITEHDPGYTKCRVDIPGKVLWTSEIDPLHIITGDKPFHLIVTDLADMGGVIMMQADLEDCLTILGDLIEKHDYQNTEI